MQSQSGSREVGIVLKNEFVFSLWRYNWLKSADIKSELKNHKNLYAACKALNNKPGNMKKKRVTKPETWRLEREGDDEYDILRMEVKKTYWDRIIY